MSSPDSPRTTTVDPVWEPPLKLVHGRRRRPAAPSVRARPAHEAGPSALQSAQALAATVFVASMAAGWLAVAATATAPLLAAGSFLGRGARLPAGQA